VIVRSVAPAVLHGYHSGMEASTQTRVILFCDCHDFSRLQLALGDRLLEFMDSFYRECGECVVANGGRIIKYIGDSILAAFPEDGADDALTAGICLRREYAALVASLKTDVDSDMEVGISCGEVAEGVVGHSSLKSFDVFGECVNEAAMIGHYRGIAVTDVLRARLSPGTEVQPLEPYHPKWRADPLVVWGVVER
jgi:class 3 adenylate cyclase